MMSIIANVPAAIASTIVACRAVRRLCKYTQQGPDFMGYVHQLRRACVCDINIIVSTTLASSLAFRTSNTTTTTTIPKRPKVNTSGLSGIDGVHVQVGLLFFDTQQASEVFPRWRHSSRRDHSLSTTRWETSSRDQEMIANMDMRTISRLSRSRTSLSARPTNHTRLDTPFSLSLFCRILAVRALTCISVLLSVKVSPLDFLQADSDAYFSCIVALRRIIRT